MKTFVALFALFAVALAAVPARRQVPVRPVVHQLSQRAAVRPVARAQIRAVPSYSAPIAAAPVVARSASLASSGSDIVVLKETLHNNDGLSGYAYNYELSDGSARDESAQVEVRGAEDAVIRVRGSYQFVGQDGQTYTVTYVADENGFQPQGAHLPVPPTLH